MVGLSLNDRRLYYSHATATDSYTLCPISDHESHTLFHLQLPYEKGMHGKPLKWTDRDGHT